MFQVIILPKAIDKLTILDRHTAKRITDKLMWLSENIELINPLPLSGNLSGLYKLKIGDYRAIYELDKNKRIITVHKIGHRRDIYR